MSHRLAVIAPQIGARSETFIRRHVQDLLPGETAVVAATASPPYAGHWSVDGPTLILDQARQSSVRRIISAVRRRLDKRPFGISEAAQFFRKHGTRVVLGEFLDFALPWLEAAKAGGMRFFGHAHGYDVSERLRDPHWRREYQRYRQADGVITMSRTSRTALIEIGLEPSKVHVVPYGVDVPAAPIQRAATDTIRCVAVGRMVAKKAPILLLDAFRRALQTSPGLRLDYIGGGELFSAASDFVRAFDLSDVVTFHGGQPSEFVQRTMCEVDVFLQHSVTDEAGDQEGLPVAILEAMALGLPVISTRHAGIPEAVREGETGYLVDEGDSMGMADRLILLAQDAALRRRLGEAGWETARDGFTWEKERRNLLAILGLA